MNNQNAVFAELARMLRSRYSEDEQKESDKLEEKLKAAGYDDNRLCMVSTAQQMLTQLSQLKPFLTCLWHLGKDHRLLSAAKAYHALSVMLNDAVGCMHTAQTTIGVEMCPFKRDFAQNAIRDSLELIAELEKE